jgi:hypothetical protein
MLCNPCPTPMRRSTSRKQADVRGIRVMRIEITNPWKRERMGGDIKGDACHQIPPPPDPAHVGNERTSVDAPEEEDARKKRLDRTGTMTAQRMEMRKCMHHVATTGTPPAGGARRKGAACGITIGDTNESATAMTIGMNAPATGAGMSGMRKTCTATSPGGDTTTKGTICGMSGLDAPVRVPGIGRRISLAIATHGDSLFIDIRTMTTSERPSCLTDKIDGCVTRGMGGDPLLVGTLAPLMITGVVEARMIWADIGPGHARPIAPLTMGTPSDAPALPSPHSSRIGMRVILL